MRWNHYSKQRESVRTTPSNQREQEERRLRWRGEHFSGLSTKHIHKQDLCFHFGEERKVSFLRLEMKNLLFKLEKKGNVMSNNTGV